MKLGKPPMKIVLGTASFGNPDSPFATVHKVDSVVQMIQTFRARGYCDVDTARAYPHGSLGSCENLLGHQDVGLKKWANVSSKVLSFVPGSHSQSKIDESIETSLIALGVDCLDVLYLHGPDPTTPLLEVCRSVNKAYMQGKFHHFGLSNFSAHQVENVVEICKEHGLLAPTIYQGQYNCLCRSAEDDLLPLLRRYKIAFWAYSPMAGGFLVDAIVRQAPASTHPRWMSNTRLGSCYRDFYVHPGVLTAVRNIQHAAEQHGVTGYAAALRWIIWHSSLAAEEGDGIVLGASNVAQLQENLDIIEQGPLEETLVAVIEIAWRQVLHSGKAPSYSLDTCKNL